MVRIQQIIISIIICVTVSFLSSCSSVKLSVADAQMKRGEYFDAAKTYKKLYNKLKSKEMRQLRAEVAFKMGECYRHIGQDASAATDYRNALRYGYPDSIAVLYMAQSQHGEGKYQPAIENYREYLKYNPDDRQAAVGLAGALKSAEIKKNKTRYVVKNARLFNSRRSDFAPMFNGDLLYFTTTNEKVKGTTRSEITGLKRSDIWMVRKNEHDRWQTPEPVEGELNTEWDEGIVSFSPDGSTMYLTRAVRSNSSDSGVEICVSRRSDAQWSAPEKFEITADTLSSYAHPAVSPSGEYLYFTSDMPGYGGKDLWRINLKERAGSLENLGNAVNTPGDEMFPYMLTDSILMFASDGHPGLGGLGNSGQYYDKDEEPVAGAVIRIVGDDGTNLKTTARNDGFFSFPLNAGVKYAMMAGAKGFLNARQEFTSDTAEQDADYSIDFFLASITKPNIVDNIFYDFDKASLRPESEKALDEIAQMLRDNPNITVEMASHTDRHGSDEYNINLSLRRAKSVVDYLINAGIPAERLQAQGYGESRPKKVTKRIAREHPELPEGQLLDEEYIMTLPEELQEIADQINRRTEFQVLSINYNMF